MHWPEGARSTGVIKEPTQNGTEYHVNSSKAANMPWNAENEKKLARRWPGERTEVIYTDIQGDSLGAPGHGGRNEVLESVLVQVLAVRHQLQDPMGAWRRHTTTSASKQGHKKGQSRATGRVAWRLQAHVQDPLYPYGLQELAPRRVVVAAHIQKVWDDLRRERAGLHLLRRLLTVPTYTARLAIRVVVVMVADEAGVLTFAFPRHV